MEYLIGEKEAQEQIDKFCDWYDIDMTEAESLAASEGIAAYDMTRRRLIKAFRQGRLEVEERADPKLGTTLVVRQRLTHPVGASAQDEILYHEITGRVKSAVRVSKGASETGALFAALAVAAKEPVQVFEALRGGDIGVAQLFGFLFLQV